ncbi:MAG: UbiA family prenyltransferase [Bacteroidota bacterium]
MYAKDDNITAFNLFDRDTVLHLRVPFSFFLLPVFWFGISQATNIHLSDTVIVFIALHLFIYPGSNVYNSYMDKDTGSIGGLKEPPPVTKKLYYASIVVDIAGLALCLFAGWQNMLVMMGYTAFSKAYSWEGIRLKKFGYFGWASVMFFQGGYTYMLASMAAEGVHGAEWFTAKHIECMVFASLIIGGYYPLTQIYQHDEDSTRGDLTISYKLGVKGTFIFAAALFAAGTAVIFHYFTTYYTTSHFFVYLGCLLPVIGYFIYWFARAVKDPSTADYDHAMLMTRLSAACMVVCFTVILIMNQLASK